MNAENISDAPETIHRHPTTREALRDALLELLCASRHEFMMVAPAPDPAHWNTSAFADALGHLIARHPHARARMVVEDSEQLLRACPRLVELVRRFSDRIFIQRLGETHRGLRSQFAVADRDSCFVQTDPDQTDATLDLHAPRQAAPWLQRFEDIWSGTEPVPGLHGFRL